MGRDRPAHGARPLTTTVEPDHGFAPDLRPAALGSGRETLGIIAFSFASFLGSALLFMIEPMVAKMLLPLLGGSASVWNLAMVFFQIVLLGGYVFAHVSIGPSGRGLPSRRSLEQP